MLINASSLETIDASVSSASLTRRTSLVTTREALRGHEFPPCFFGFTPRIHAAPYKMVRSVGLLLLATGLVAAEYSGKVKSCPA